MPEVRFVVGLSCVFLYARSTDRFRRCLALYIERLIEVREGQYRRMKQKHVGGERIVAKLVVGPCEKCGFWRLPFNVKFSGDMAEVCNVLKGKNRLNISIYKMPFSIVTETTKIAPKLE